MFLNAHTAVLDFPSKTERKDLVDHKAMMQLCGVFYSATQIFWVVRCIPANIGFSESRELVWV